MRKKILAAIIFVGLATLSSLPANAEAMTTKLTLIITATPNDDELSHEVSADFLDERGVFTGSNIEAETFTDTQGRSVTETLTEFMNIHGELLMSADIAITSESNDFTVKSGERFSRTFSVDVTIELFASSYDEYIYSLDVEGFPEWLRLSGETNSNDVIGVGINEYHHEFLLYGTTEASHDMAALVFNAMIYVSGDYPVLLAVGSKGVNISAETVPKPPDHVPKYDEISPDVVPKPPENETMTLADSVSHMTTGQKAAVINLKIGANITDLTGLEDFTSLERLDLTEAVGLETVDLSGNSTVKIVDASGNSGLRVLDVSNTQIMSLNVENCTGLEFLDCSNCLLEELKLSGCEFLNVLDCSNNRLHRLDVYMLEKLEVLICYNQQITGWRIGQVFSFEEKFARLTAADYGNGTGIENIINLKAWDTDGNEISAEYDPNTGTAKFGGIPEKVAYDYVTGFEDVLMDVTIFTVENVDEGGTRFNTSSGGCNVGISLSVLAAWILLKMLKRKRE